MKPIEKISPNLEKLSMLSEIYKDLLNREIKSEQEFETVQMKISVAKSHMEKLTYNIHRLIEKQKAH